MEGYIKIDAGGMDRKYFYALIKGLVQIKYKTYFLNHKDTAADLDESMDMQFLYSNLFNSSDTTLDGKIFPQLFL